MEGDKKTFLLYYVEETNRRLEVIESKVDILLQSNATKTQQLKLVVIGVSTIVGCLSAIMVELIKRIIG